MAGRRKENDREELKLRVVETASKSFMTLGIKAVHMDDIASSLSISKRTLYELFGDKEELLLEVFRFYRRCIVYARDCFQREQCAGSNPYIL